jgi:hypothetical protein
MTGRKISGKGGGMKHANLLPRALPGLACLFALTACHNPPPLVTNCPNVAVLEQGRVVTVFLPGRQDVAAEIAQAKITLEKKKQTLRVTFQAGFAATNGPANTSPTLNLPYLIALSEGDNLLSTKSGSITLKFNGNESNTTAATKPITYEFPNTPETATMDLLVSFHLTPEQLSYNAAHPAP